MILEQEVGAFVPELSGIPKKNIACQNVFAILKVRGWYWEF